MPRVSLRNVCRTSFPRKHLQSIIEEYEAVNEETKAANEEVLSSNEELQSINEELETAKEELQSANEELTTLNDELQNRNLALDQLNNDVINLLTSVNLPVIMLGSDLRIRRFTSVAEKVLKITATDIGRSIDHLQLGFSVPDLETSILEAINTGATKVEEIQDREGVWYSLQIRPYRTIENKIEGAVLTWIDIHALKQSLEETKESRDYAHAIVETVRESLLILDKGLRVKTANRSFYQTFQTSPDETEGRVIYNLGNNQWDMPDLKILLEEILPQNVSFGDLEIERTFPVIGNRTMLLNARRIAQKGDGANLILLAIEDITERKRLDKMLQDAELRRCLSSQVLAAQEKERKRIAHELHDGLAADLAAIKYSLERKINGNEEDPSRGTQIEEIISNIQRTIEEVRSIMNNLPPPFSMI